MATEEKVDALAIVKETVESWESEYKLSIHETECKVDTSRTFVVICSKPTPTRPVPDCVVNVHVSVDEAGEQPVLTFKGEDAYAACGVAGWWLVITRSCTPTSQLRIRRMCTRAPSNLRPWRIP